MTEETKFDRPTDEESGHPEETCVSQSSQEKLAESVLPSISPEKHGGEENLQHSATANTNLPDSQLVLLEQLAFSVPGAKLGTPLAMTRGHGAVEYYQSFEPADAFESTIARLTVGCTNAAMDGLERAAALNQTDDARAVELRLANKATATVINLLTLLDKHRGLGRQNISSVNLAGGAKALVGNVHSASAPQLSSEDDEQLNPGGRNDAKPSQA